MSYQERKHSDISERVNGCNAPGGPGVGKGTQCTRLAEDLRLVHVSVGDLLRAEAEKPSDGQNVNIKAIMGNASLVPYTCVQNVLQRCLVQHLKNGQFKFLIDGFPRSKQQAEHFECQVSAPSAKAMRPKD